MLNKNSQAIHAPPIGGLPVCRKQIQENITPSGVTHSQRVSPDGHSIRFASSAAAYFASFRFGRS
ncbi:hypothetical protein MgSA37_03754 [Mucilaginibacter gotjawali]|uniref:Uncharacterized protein n=2 Tax=Mucilaginibacter gotjawali TaxID=1550579 RepID=A0A839SPL1_9SPHI|nr:hypothetical protein [Mucilaginibacter gotjawali]BAU55564.1 hypothetical protein MgSA37_03754 [Mucilaginibacter gotjawali]